LGAPEKNTRRLGRFNRFMLWLNYFAAIVLLLSVLAAYISPRTFWPMAFFGISFPVIFCINLFFIIWWGMQMRWWALLSAGMILLSGNNLLGNLQYHGTQKVPDKSDIKVLNYNCMLFDLYNWSHNKQSRHLIFSMLQEESPDILCLQEFYTSEQKGDYNNADTLQKFLKAKNMHAEFTTTLREFDHWGIATFTKYPIVRKGKIEFNTASNNICIYTDMLIDGDTVRVYNLHLASISFGKKEYKFLDDIGNQKIEDPYLDGSKSIFKRLKKGFLERAGQVEHVKAHMEACAYKKILCGDLNDTPSSFAYHTIKKGLKDAFRESGRGVGKTYRGHLPFLRIDYILHDPAFSSTNYRQNPESLTDHYPVSCYLHFISGN
jgi:endonuclease/exonuclease/phosphatase family metal-dependent hydrolase